jgi:hypothetical protein
MGQERLTGFIDFFTTESTGHTEKIECVCFGDWLRATGYRVRAGGIFPYMIRKLKSGEYRLYSKKKNPSTGKRRNLGTFSSREKAEQHERAVQYFKRH